jgi:ribonuclease D
VIDTETKLAKFLPELMAAAWVALDTEADSLHAYPEKLCLIQISITTGDYLLDPLAGASMDPLLDALAGRELIMHGADYDLRLLRKHHEFVPSAVFDTMLAARLIGERQFGYSHLVGKFLGVPLEKGAQKANWAMRPLTERMEQYARNDTHHLKSLADRLKSELEARGRLAWHQESCARLIVESSNASGPDPDTVWRIKGSHLLGRPALAVLRELWKWRETEAVRANRPPFFIMSHEALVNASDAAAGHRPVDPLLPRHISERRRAALTEAIAAGLAVLPARHPEIPRRIVRRPTEAERLRFVDLQNIRDARATALDIDPTLIASRATLLDLARSWDQHQAELMNWQRQLLLPA